MSLIGELKRRSVFKVAVAYLVAAWLIVQLTEIPMTRSCSALSTR